MSDFYELQDLKTKKILILGGKPIGTADIINYAKEKGFYTIACDYLPVEKSPAKLLADEYWDYSTADVDLIVERAKAENVSAVFTGVHEFNIKKCEEVCKKMGLPFYATCEDLEITSNKKVYKNILKKSGIRVIKDYKITDFNSIPKDIKYPILIKPTDGSGAYGINICNSEDELKIKLKHTLNFTNKKEIIAEEYIKDKDEITTVYIIRNGIAYLASVADRIVKYFDNSVIPLPVAYIWNSKYLDLYRNTVDAKMKKVIKSMGLKNGMLFIQCIVKNNVIMPYDMGFRLSGTQEHVILENICGYNPLKLLTDYATTGRFGDKNLAEKINPEFDCSAAQITFLVKPCTIGRFEGLEKVKKMPEVIRIIKNKSEGETVRNSDYGTLNQIALRIFLKAENKNELKKLIRKIRACVKIYSPLGDDVRVTKTKWKDKIFSVKDKNIHKVITILGVKLKFKSKNLILEHQINCLENENKFLSEKIDETQKKYEELNKKMSEWLTANFRYTEHTNKILNRIIEKFDDEELKIEQIKYLFKGVHKNEYDINIAEPKTFNEKIHWLSLNQYSNNPLIAKIVDKLTFKDYIKETLGEGYTIPLLGSWDNPCEIDYEKLPQKFVLKSNWGGDGKQVLIVKDKSLLNKTEANDKMREWLSFSGNSYYYAFNGPVQTITPCILAEEYIETSANMLNDYKFMCFNGEPLWILACSDRGDNTKYENHDMNWNLFVPSSKSAKIPKIEPPKNFDKMVELAKTLSKPFPFVRVDFYEVDDRVYVGEMTFTPKGGFNHYYKKWDLKFGEKLDISYLMKGKENV